MIVVVLAVLVTVLLVVEKEGIQLKQRQYKDKEKNTRKTRKYK